MDKKYSVPPYIIKFVMDNFPAGVSRRVVEHYRKYGGLPGTINYMGRRYEVSRRYGEACFAEAKSKVLSMSA
jgi:hypothetical protein